MVVIREFLKIIITILIGHPIIIDFYEFLFTAKRDKIKRVLSLELELIKFLIKNLVRKIETGASLRVWNEYFKNATIYGGDIDKSTLFEEKKLKLFMLIKLVKSQLKICGKISRFQILT